MFNDTGTNGVPTQFGINEFNDVSSNITQRQFGREYFLNIIQMLICPVRENYIRRLIVFVLFIVFGVLGNVTLLIVIIKNKSLRNAPNILISNLALADLLYILVTGPIHFENEIHPCWFSGKIPCALRNYAPVVFRCASAYSLVALSRERYLVIVVRGIHGFKSNTKVVSFVSALLAWLVGLIAASPILTPNFTSVYGLYNITFSCATVFRGSQRAQTFEICKFIITYAIPLVVIAIHCSIMTNFLIVSTNRFKRQNDTFKQQNKTRMRLAYMTIIIPIFFCLLSLPSVIFDFMFHFKSPQGFQGEIKFRHLSYFMSLANSSLNPWLVFFLSSAHRERLKWCITCRKPNENLRARCISQSTSVRILSHTNQSASRDLSVDNSENIRLRNNSVNKDEEEFRPDVYKVNVKETAVVLDIKRNVIEEETV